MVPVHQTNILSPSSRQKWLLTWGWRKYVDLHLWDCNYKTTVLPHMCLSAIHKAWINISVTELFDWPLYFYCLLTALLFLLITDNTPNFSYTASFSNGPEGHAFISISLLTSCRAGGLQWHVHVVSWISAIFTDVTKLEKVLTDMCSQEVWFHRKTPKVRC
jgi:hypothetical protein